MQAALPKISWPVTTPIAPMCLLPSAGAVRGGEIDLIMRNGTQVVFVEVKKSGGFARAATRLQRRQMDGLVAAGSEFLASAPMGQLTDVRFDLALVNGIGDAQIIENAFDAG